MSWLDWLKIASASLPHPELADRIVEAAESQLYGAKLSRAPLTVNLVYGEGMNADGTWNGNPIDKWNDQRMLIAWSAGRPQIMGMWPATTTVGTYYDKTHPLYPERGAPLIAFGQQACWQVGIHHPGGAHEALVQTGGEVACYFDPQRIFRRYGPIQRGSWGINHHGPGTMHPLANPSSVEGYSAGCLVARSMADHYAFMDMLKRDPRYVTNHQHVFDATVLPASAWN